MVDALMYIRNIQNGLWDPKGQNIYTLHYDESPAYIKKETIKTKRAMLRTKYIIY